MAAFVRANGIELTVFLAVLVGVAAIIIERQDILRWQAQLEQFSKTLELFFNQFGLLDILGAIGLVAGLVFIAWRVRVRFLASDRWRATICPKCGGEIQRIHRTNLDRLLGTTLLPHSRRYFCSKCNWSGLRHRGGDKHHDPLDGAPAVRPGPTRKG